MFAGFALALLVSIALAYGQTRSGYRALELGATLSSVSAAAKAAVANAKTIHARPALMQELEWRAPYSTDERGSDPVQQIVFSFYNDQLYKIVVGYDHSRTAGMADTDMIEGISATYGTPLKASARQTTARYGEAEDGTSIARWGGVDQTVVLYRSSAFFGSSTARYWLIVMSPRLDALARSASAEAIRLGDREAPQRAAAQQKKDAADARAAEEKARAENKAAFRP